jgi:hypothetical protein
MSYSPNWSPGTPLEADETISRAEKLRLYRESKDAGNWTDADDKAFWADDPQGKPSNA